MQSANLFEELLKREGGVSGHFFGQEAVLHFGDWKAEFGAFKQAAGLVCLGPSSQIELTGKDRGALLNRLSTNKVDRIPPGAGCETFLTSVKGHVLAHLCVFARPESLVLRTVAGESKKILAHLDHYLVRDDVQLNDRSPQWAELLLAGPRSAEALGRLRPAALPTAHLAHVEVPWAGGTASIRRIVAGRADVFLVSTQAEAAGPLWHALREAGASPCGHRAMEAFRIQLGWPVYGRDLDDGNLPQEIGRDALAISLTKGCYLGQETVARIDSRGHVNKTLVGLRFDGPDVPPPDVALEQEGRAAGHVTSAAFAPDFDAAVALAYVRRGLESPGTRLESPLGAATVVALPME